MDEIEELKKSEKSYKDKIEDLISQNKKSFSEIKENLKQNKVLKIDPAKPFANLNTPLSVENFVKAALANPDYGKYPSLPWNSNYKLLPKSSVEETMKTIPKKALKLLNQFFAKHPYTVGDHGYGGQKNEVTIPELES